MGVQVVAIIGVIGCIWGVYKYFQIWKRGIAELYIFTILGLIFMGLGLTTIIFSASGPYFVMAIAFGLAMVMFLIQSLLSSKKARLQK